MIGLNLYACVQDIAEGRVALERVEKILTSASVATAKDRDYLIAECRWEFWFRDPDRLERIARELFEQGKVERCRSFDRLAISRRADRLFGNWIEGGEVSH